MDHFTPIASTIGGVLIGLSAVLLLLFNGKIAGISGITGGLIQSPSRGDGAWRFAFVFGLVSAGVIGALIAPQAFAVNVDRSAPALILAGLLVGFGTRTGNGCTSGHGVCGLGRLSRRSLAATLSFMTTGALAAFVVNHLLGGTL
jgi:uncharacterized membrane protein YedE/YeeE